jgi:hypothetical protein
MYCSMEKVVLVLVVVVVVTQNHIDPTSCE